MFRSVIFIFIAILSVNARDFSNELRALQKGERTDARLEWWGFNADDSTGILKSALSSGARKLYIDKKPAPWFSTETLRIPADIEIIFEDGAELKAKPGHFKNITDSLLVIDKGKNVTISGKGIISMNRKDYLDKSQYKHAEWRHTLSIFNSQNISIRDMVFAESGGDGIYINSVRDMVVEKVHCRDNARQGISVISAENLLIRDCVFSGTAGAAPQAGIDFEPNRKHEKLINCKVENCQFINNAGDGISIWLPYDHTSLPFDITFSNCRIENNQGGTSILAAAGPAGQGVIKFQDCIFKNSKDYSFVSVGNTASIHLENTVIDNSTSKDRAAIRVQGRFTTGTLGNIHADNVKVIDTNPQYQLFGFSGWRLYPLENMTGKIVHQSGKVFNLADAVEKSKQMKPLKSAELDYTRLRPAGEVPVNGGEEPWNMRFGGEFLQYASADAGVELNFAVTPIGSTPQGVTITGIAPSGKEIGKWNIPSGQKTFQLKFQADETGTYQIDFRSQSGVKISSNLPGCGYLATKSVRVFRSKGRMYFMVPKGVEEVAVRISGDNAAEWVSASLFNAAGVKVQSEKFVTEAALLIHKRSAADKNEIWSVNIDGCVEDYNLSIMGDSIPVFSSDRNRLLQLAD